MGTREVSLEFRKPEGIRDTVCIQGSDHFFARGTHGGVPGSRQSSIGAMANDGDSWIAAGDFDGLILRTVVNEQYFVRRLRLSEKTLDRRGQEIGDIERGDVNSDLRHAGSAHLSEAKKYQRCLPIKPRRSHKGCARM